MDTIYIDANIYLEFYQSPEVRQKLLPPLLTLAPRIFVTRQIAREVDRNKLAKVNDPLVENYKRFDTKIKVTDQALAASPDELSAVRALLAAGEQKYQDAQGRITELIHRTLEQVQDSRDTVSVQLETIFRNAVAETDDELARARKRKEFGDPPGKKNDTLGDQLSWEQYLSVAATRNPLWLITKDGDYFDEYAGKLFLKPTLMKDLADRVSGEVRVKVFKSLSDALKEFKRTSGLDVTTMPSDDALVAIEKEERRLPTKRFGRTYGRCPECNASTTAAHLYVMLEGNEIVQRAVCNRCRTDYPISAYPTDETVYGRPSE